MPKKKKAIIIQARMSSNRLPGKVMLPLPFPDGNPMLGKIIDQLKEISIDWDIFVATSQQPEDDILEELCKSKNIHCFRGSTTNVLSRYQEIAKNGEYEILLRYTGDNPFIDKNVIRKTLDFHMDQKADLTLSKGLPLGIHVEIVDAKKLIALENEELKPQDEEHVTWFLKNNPNYKIVELDFKTSPEIQKLRLSVDYASDFILASSIFELGKKHKNLSGLALIEKIHQDYAWLFSINSSNLQKNPPNSLKEELLQAKEVLWNQDLFRAAGLINQHIKE